MQIMDLTSSRTHHEQAVVHHFFDYPKLIDLIVIRLAFWLRKNVVSSRPWTLTVLAQSIYNEFTRLVSPFRHGGTALHSETGF